jgi:hypothetical protein
VPTHPHAILDRLKKRGECRDKGKIGDWSSYRKKIDLIPSKIKKNNPSVNIIYVSAVDSPLCIFDTVLGIISTNAVTKENT